MATVRISSVFDAPVETVWARMNDFNGLPNWHPRMVESHIEDGLPSGHVGGVRRFKLVSGATIREKLLGLSDLDHSVTYSILETPQPLSNPVATLKLTPLTDGDRTFAEWTASFDAPPDEADKLAKGTGDNVFQGGFNAEEPFFGTELSNSSGASPWA